MERDASFVNTDRTQTQHKQPHVIYARPESIPPKRELLVVNYASLEHFLRPERIPLKRGLLVVNYASQALFRRSLAHI